MEKNGDNAEDRHGENSTQSTSHFKAHDEWQQDNDRVEFECFAHEFRADDAEDNLLDENKYDEDKYRLCGVGQSRQEKGRDECECRANERDER